MLGRPLWDRRITTELSFDVKVCQGFYWFRLGSRAGSYEVGDVLRIPYKKKVVNFWNCYAKRGLHEATALEIRWLQVTVYCRDDELTACGKTSLVAGMYCSPSSFCYFYYCLFILPDQRLYIVKNMCKYTQWRTQEFCSWGGVQQIQLRTEDRENGDLEGGSPLVRGSGGSCNLVQEISFHMVKFS